LKKIPDLPPGASAAAIVRRSNVRLSQRSSFVALQKIVASQHKSY
jgi:hypothetical protein